MVRSRSISSIVINCICCTLPIKSSDDELSCLHCPRKLHYWCAGPKMPILCYMCECPDRRTPIQDIRFVDEYPEYNLLDNSSVAQVQDIAHFHDVREFNGMTSAHNCPTCNESIKKKKSLKCCVCSRNYHHSCLPLISQTQTKLEKCPLCLGHARRRGNDTQISIKTDVDKWITRQNANKPPVYPITTNAMTKREKISSTVSNTRQSGKYTEISASNIIIPLMKSIGIDDNVTESLFWIEKNKITRSSLQKINNYTLKTTVQFEKVYDDENDENDKNDENDVSDDCDDTDDCDDCDDTDDCDDCDDTDDTDDCDTDDGDYESDSDSEDDDSDSDSGSDSESSSSESESDSEDDSPRRSPRRH